MKFKINEELSKNFEQVAKNLKSGKFEFIIHPKKNDWRKTYKIIASLVEDQWSVLKVIQGENSLLLDMKKRQKHEFTFPEKDSHFNRKKDRYQYHTLLAAMSFVKKMNCAVDIGGHIGLYSDALSDSFGKVFAFEPSPENIKCFKKNAKKAVLYPYGLGAEPTKLFLNLAEDNSGNNSLVEKFDGHQVEIEIKRLDDFEFEEIDLIKIDVQGYEPQVLLGAKSTIKKHRPIIIVELITHKDDPPNQWAMNILKEYDYQTLMIMGKDYIMGPRG